MTEENPYTPPSSDVVPERIEEEEELATRGQRLGGAIIDGLIAMAIFFPLMFLTGYWERAQTGSVTLTENLMLAVLGFVVFMLIHGYLLSTRGQTVGKYLVGTRIVSFEDDRILSFGKVIGLRYLPISVIAQIPFVGGLFSLFDALLIFWPPRRCIHDYIAGTKVITVRKE